MKFSLCIKEQVPKFLHFQLPKYLVMHICSFAFIFREISIILCFSVLINKIHFRIMKIASHFFVLRVSSFSKISYDICLNTYAPKATETPAAEAADKISLFFASFRPYLGNR